MRLYQGQRGFVFLLHQSAGVLFIPYLQLFIRRGESGRSHEALDTSPCVPVPIARMTHFAVMVMSNALALGKIPDTPFTEAIWNPIQVHRAEMRLLCLSRLYPGTEAPFSTEMCGGKDGGLPQKIVGFDHGVGHPLRLLCNAKAPNS